MKYKLAQKVLDKVTSTSYLTVIFDDWFLELRDQVEQDLLRLSVWMGEWLLKNEEWQAAKHQLQKFMHIFDDDEEIHAVLFELYSQIPDHELDDWIKEKAQSIGFT